ncbi:histone-lysine N-trimethyltransferase SMYD5 isoform X1 [Hyalella azteca]|uniref:Histone-lysine N-trimethyltransferase SMYD5 isoform X1 n=1 Tax=Hyalella azteca TaxID=294128 RepID=A0A8B7MYH3_HYAAZ|nr:histone-lysine N-trimethyltransferase SMYD5 isoform X2 [Hyalella azteca]XP_018006623.1 histone-lysine N-trimethyltransferase SMYD5 isoform X1 [Hyalella azteca]
MATALVSDMYTAAEQRAASVTAVEERFISQAMGRGLFATRQFREDDLIFEETPVVSCQFVYNKEYGYRACDQCLRSLETAECNVRRLCQEPLLVLPHPECADTALPAVLLCPGCQAEYCSEECRREAWQQHHQLLCYAPSHSDHPLTRLLVEWKQHHYPPETLSILLLARLLAGVLLSPDAVTASASLARFCHASVSARDAASHKLLGPEFVQHIHALRTLMAEVFPDPRLAEWMSEEGFKSLLALVGSNGQGVASSPLARWVTRCDDLPLKGQDRDQLDAFIDNLYEKLDSTVGTFLNTEGSGLYRLQSLLNHSCRPNAIVTFPHNSHTLQVRAVRDIAPGQPVFISYLDDCTLARSRHSRRKTLRENYVFACACERCDDETIQPDVTSDEDMDDDEQ